MSAIRQDTPRRPSFRGSSPGEMFDRLAALGADPAWSRATLLARCIHPDHDDNSPSMTLRRGRTSWLLHCFACVPRTADRRGWAREVFAVLDDPHSVPLAPSSGPHARKNGAGGVQGKRVATYEYEAWRTDLVVARLDRYEGPSGKSFVWRHKAGPAWLPGLAPYSLDDLSPYGEHRLPDLDGQVVYVCEGEKAVDLAWERGLLAVSTPGGGAAGARGSDDPWLWLRDTRTEVVIVADRDAVGLDWAWRVQRMIDPGCRRIFASEGRVHTVTPHPRYGDHADLADVLTHPDGLDDGLVDDLDDLGDIL